MPSPRSDTGARARRGRAHLAWLIVGFGLLYGLTATWDLSANVDAISAALPAWSLVMDGTIRLDRFAGLNPWIVESAIGFVSNRPPGLSALAVPAYALTRPEVFTNAPATATAVAAAVGALAVVYLVLVPLVDQRTALIATIVMGLGTSTWSVSADSLWPHGPGQLFAALGLLYLAPAREVRSGVALGAALLVRPVTAVSTGFIGIWEAWQQRSWRPAFRLGVPACIALALLMGYNRFVFGSFSISGGYPADFADRLTTPDAGGWLSNIAAVFASPDVGLLVWSPVVAVAAVGTVAVWSSLPGWTRSAALGGLVYLLVHARLNRASGGLPFGYRYPLEPLVLLAPALTLGGVHIASLSRRLKGMLWVSIGVSVLFQLALVFLLECEDLPNTEVVCSFF